MKNRLFKLLLIIIVLGGWILSAAQPAAAQDGQPRVVRLTLDGPLTSSLVDYIKRGLDTAEREQAQAVILRLNTPGGAINLMTSIIEDLRGSTVPVIVYVAPNGAMAGSAGTLITLAGHLAVMAPETAIGAASPVGDQGQDIGQTEAAKVKNIMKATARSLTERRGEKAVALAEDTIENARAASAKQALDAGLIDFIASDINDLLNQADGRSVQAGNQTVVLRTRGALVEDINNSFIEQLLALLTNPNLVFLLLALGIQAILIEISSPGGWVAGFIGVVCVALAIYGMGFLPVNWFGFIFLITAFVLFILDIKAPTHGALTVAGVGSFILGSLVLFNGPGVPQFQRVSVPLIIGTSIFLAAAFFTILTFALRAQRAPVRTGRESIVGKIGTARTVLDPSGTVQVYGEHWSAQIPEGEDPVQPGEKVVVVAAEGLRLIVRKAQ